MTHRGYTLLRYAVESIPKYSGPLKNDSEGKHFYNGPHFSVLKEPGVLGEPRAARRSELGDNHGLAPLTRVWPIDYKKGTSVVRKLNEIRWKTPDYAIQRLRVDLEDLK